MEIYNKDVDSLLSELDVNDQNGLSEEQVSQRLEKYGKNEIKRGKEDTWLNVLIDQFKSTIIVVLFAAMIISTLLAYNEFKFSGNILLNYSEPIVIFILTAFNLILGFSQDLKAFNEAKKLTQFTAAKTKVRRNGEVISVYSDQLVPGDIVILDQGASIKADLRLIEEFDIKVQESFLTGESEDIEKHVAAIDGKKDVNEQSNMIFSGSFITNGRGEAVVVATGFETQIGQLVEEVDDTAKATSTLKEGMEDLNKKLFLIAILFTILTIVGSFIRSFSTKEIFNNAVSMMVATMPEALPTVLTIVLTATSIRMTKEKALIKKTELIESLGQVDVICSDKTGTITEGNMTVVQFFDADKNVDNKEYNNKQVLEFSALTLGTSVDSYNNISGTPTEIAIAKLALENGIKKEDIELNNYKIIDELAFSSVYKKSGAIVQDLRTNKYFVIFLGAFDFMIGDCTKQGLDLTNIDKNYFEDKIKEYGSNALRTIAISFKEIDENQALNNSVMDLSSELSMIGIYGIKDPVKQSAVKTIDELKEAGISVVMITGDYPATARQIAIDAHIIDPNYKIEDVMTGKHLDEISDEELFNIVNDIHVYARVRPDHKVRIIKALQKHDKVVAMTGDGVNDSIALKRSNIGIVMGLTGSDISKESGDLILLDDDFETIEIAVKEGRVVFENIRKFTRQLTTDNVAIAMSLIFSLMFSRHNLVALTPLSVLWVNTISDSIPSIALGFDGADKDIMKQPPRSKDEKIFTKSLLINIFVRGIMLGMFTFLGNEIMYEITKDKEVASTFAFVVLSFGAVIHNFDSRARVTLFSNNFFGNKQLIWSVIGSTILNILVVYTPLNVIMGMKPLEPMVFIYGILIGFIPTLGISAVKEMYLKFKK